jgi:hypothetical protein
MRLIIAPRWGGDESSDFYPWLRDEIGDRFDEVVAAPLLPAADAPEIEPTVAALLSLLEIDPARTYVLGHSVGCQATLRALARLAPARIAGCVLVAAWLSVDEPWPAIEPWQSEPIDDAAVRQAAGQIRALVSTDDPFTADHARTRELLASRFRAGVRVVEGGAHFNSEREPEVLRALRALLD